MARNVRIEGTITRVVDSTVVEIPFFIDVETESYQQWGYASTQTLGANVGLMEALRDAAVNAE